MRLYKTVGAPGDFVAWSDGWVYPAAPTASVDAGACFHPALWDRVY